MSHGPTACDWCVTHRSLENKKMFNAIMLSITFALSFALMFLGLIVAIHFQTWIGLAMVLGGGLRFFRDLHFN